MPRQKQTAIWNYFTNNEAEGLAFCKTCNNSLKNNKISNLKNHLRRLHDINIDSNIKISKPRTLKVIPDGEVEIEINKKQFLRSYIGLIIEDSIPLNILNSPNMKNLMMPLCEGLKGVNERKMCLNSYNCKKTLQVVANNIRSDIIIMDVKNKLLSLKIDSSKGLCPDIFVVSAQFLSHNQIKYHILGIVDLKGIRSSTNKNLANEVIRILKKYDISLKQIVSVTSDNGADMLKSNKTLFSVSEEGILENEADYENDEYLKKIELVEEMPYMLLGNIQVCHYAAHTAQLCALEMTKSSALTKYFLTCRDVTKYLRNISNGYRDIFELKKLEMPQLDSPTRWGSTYKMIENLKAAKEIVNQIKFIKSETQDRNFEIDDSFWEFIDMYCLVFNPLQKAIKIFQSEQLHYSSFYAQWLICKICTEKIIKDSNQLLIKTVGEAILQSFDKRTAALMCNNGLLACLYLDPRFHHTLTTKQKSEAIQYLKSIWDRIIEINPEAAMCSAPDSSLDPNADQFFSLEEKLLNEFIKQGVEANIGVPTDVYSKIQNLQLPFQRSDTNVLEFWKEREFSDPELYILSSVCFAIPANQVNIDEAFSILRTILMEYRNRLSDETLENLLLVKLNPNFLDDAIENLPLFQDEDGDEQY